MTGRKKHTSKRVINYIEDPIGIRVPKPDYEYDHDLAEDILKTSVQIQNVINVKPNGKCYSCGKLIPPMRRLCGQCNSHREFNHRKR